MSQTIELKEEEIRLLKNSLQDSAALAEQHESAISGLKEQFMGQTQKLLLSKEKISQREADLQAQLEQLVQQSASASQANLEQQKQLMQM